MPDTRCQASRAAKCPHLASRLGRPTTAPLQIVRAPAPHAAMSMPSRGRPPAISQTPGSAPQRPEHRRSTPSRPDGATALQGRARRRSAPRTVGIQHSALAAQGTPTPSLQHRQGRRELGGQAQRREEPPADAPRLQCQEERRPAIREAAHAQQEVDACIGAARSTQWTPFPIRSHHHRTPNSTSAGSRRTESRHRSMRIRGADNAYGQSKPPEHEAPGASAGYAGGRSVRDDGVDVDETHEDGN
ncbi:hypothetical protein C8J57DRAFT_1523785 [Mycena rebaudengoi]|nr:hypothetical protein C8J57DRAFT_1523785 [Mycena rebaudengoi]